MKYLNLALLALVLPLASTFAGEHPCKEARSSVEAACKTAGFVKGDKKGHALFKDCVEPIMKEGKTIPNVTVDPAVLQACQAKKEKKAKPNLPEQVQGANVKKAN